MQQSIVLPVALLTLVFYCSSASPKNGTYLGSDHDPLYIASYLYYIYRPRYVAIYLGL